MTFNSHAISADSYLSRGPSSVTVLLRNDRRKPPRLPAPTTPRINLVSAAGDSFPPTEPGPVAQRSEQGTHNPLVVGSNPTGPTFMTFAWRSFFPLGKFPQIDVRRFEPRRPHHLMATRQMAPITPVKPVYAEKTSESLDSLLGRHGIRAWKGHTHLFRPSQPSLARRVRHGACRRWPNPWRSGRSSGFRRARGSRRGSLSWRRKFPEA